MELDLQLTPRSRILLAILGGVLLILLVVQVGPLFYGLFTNQDTEVKQEELLKTKNLVNVAEVLRPVESKIYEETGLAVGTNTQFGARAQQGGTLFDSDLPETVIRARIDALVKQAGIQQNYQLLTKPATSKQTQSLTAETRANLVLYHYLKHIEAEEAELLDEMEGEEEFENFNALINAWLPGTDKDKKDTGSAEGEGEGDAEKAREAEEGAAALEFSALPEAIPLPLRAKIAGIIKEMLVRQIRGATDSRQDFFDTQINKTRIPGTPGIFGIGGTPATVEIQLRHNGILAELLGQSADESADMGALQYALVEYIEAIQEQRAALLDRLTLAPLNYQTELYTVEMKFKTDMQKLVNLNHLIETGAKWLTVRDLRIAPDTQTTARGRNSGDQPNLNVDMLLIARIF